MSRPHPFAFVFGDFADEAFPAVAEEIGSQPIDIASFTRLEATQAILQQLGSPEVAEADPGAVGEYLQLLLVAFLYWRHGTRTFAIARSVLEPRLGATGAPAGPAAIPSPAAYYELPEHWIWAQISADAPHEPLDGLFIAAVAGGAEQALAIVAVLGLREGRPGFSQISAVATARDFQSAAAAVRDPPFSATMEGGTSAGFRTVASKAELIRLAHLAMLCAPQ